MNKRSFEYIIIFLEIKKNSKHCPLSGTEKKDNIDRKNKKKKELKRIVGFTVIDRGNP